MELMWKLLKLTNDVEFDEYMLSDANNDITKAIMYLYSMETFIYTAINRATREQDESKVRTLGPYAVLLAQVLYGAQQNRDQNPPNPNKRNSIGSKKDQNQKM